MSPTTTPSADEAAVRELARALLRSWNARDAARFAACFTEDGVVVGYDGTVVEGRAQITAQLSDIFRQAQPPAYIATTQRVRLLSESVAVLRGIGGMYSPLDMTINPMLNATQIIVALKQDGVWRAASVQTTPAALHGRPDQVAQMAAELQLALDAQALR